MLIWRKLETYVKYQYLSVNMDSFILLSKAKVLNNLTIMGHPVNLGSRRARSVILAAGLEKKPVPSSFSPLFIFPSVFSI